MSRGSTSNRSKLGEQLSSTFAIHPLLSEVTPAMATLDAQLAKVRSQLNSQVEATHRAAQLLVAVEDTLQQTDAPPQAYWVALTATLNQLATDADAAKPATEKRKLLEATLYLVALVAPHLEPAQLRQAGADQLLRTLPPLLQSFASQAPALKSLIAIAQYLIASLPVPTLERDREGSRAVYATLLSLTADARPKVRRRAQEAVHAILKSPPPPAVLHPYADESAEWICTKLDEALRAAKRGGKAPAQATTENSPDESRAIALLTFIKNLGPTWPQSVGCPLETLTALTKLTPTPTVHDDAPPAPPVDADSLLATPHPRRPDSALAPLLGLARRSSSSIIDDALGRPRQADPRSADRGETESRRGERTRRKVAGRMGRGSRRGHGRTREVSARATLSRTSERLN